MDNLMLRRRQLMQLASAAPPVDPFTLYVQTNLAYQLDGIWNTLDGHDATATTWINHKSADPYKGYNYISTSVIGSNYCIPNGKLMYRGVGETTDRYMIQMTDAYSIEICVEIVPGSNRYQWIFANRGNNYGTTYIDATNGQLLFSAGSGGTGVGVSTSSGIHTYVATGKNKTYYVDGQSVSTITGGGSASTPQRTWAFYYTNSYPYPCISKIYAIRLYSRKLTAEEVAANYAIDKQRFGSGVIV